MPKTDSEEDHENHPKPYFLMCKNIRTNIKITSKMISKSIPQFMTDRSRIDARKKNAKFIETNATKDSKREPKWRNILKHACRKMMLELDESKMVNFRLVPWRGHAFPPVPGEGPGPNILIDIFIYSRTVFLIKNLRYHCFFVISLTQ